MRHLLGVDDLKPLLHLATLVAPALLVGHQRDVGVLGDTLLAVTAVHTVTVLLIAQVVVATQPRRRQRYGVTRAHRREGKPGGARSVSPLSELQVGRVVNHS